MPDHLLARWLSLSRDLPCLRSRWRSGRSPMSSWSRSSDATVTCCSTRAPAAARRRCWSSGSPARCSRTGSTSGRSSRSRSPRRPPPRCVTGFATGCGNWIPARPRRGRAGDRRRVHLDHPRVLRASAARPRARRRPRPCVRRARRSRRRSDRGCRIRRRARGARAARIGPTAPLTRDRPDRRLRRRHAAHRDHPGPRRASLAWRAPATAPGAASAARPRAVARRARASRDRRAVRTRGARPNPARRCSRRSRGSSASPR